MYVQVSEMTRDNWATCGKIVKTVNFSENQIQLIIRYMTKSSHWFYVMLFYTSINSPPSYQKHLGDCTWENPRDLKFINMGSSTLYLHEDILTSAFRWCKIMWYLLWLPGAGVGEILSREENIREKTHIRNFKCCSQFLFIETGVMQYQTVTLIYNV